jgi:ATP-dependent DNA helicase
MTFKRLLQANQLDYLLSKASEYSNFIAKDLEELQANMTEHAKQKVKEAEKGTKKGKKRVSKKQKREQSAAALKSAQDKHAQVRAGGAKTIFVQPPNLSEGCVLKDYQLEGVRWLSSLFENGVSGILADEMVSQCWPSCVFDRCLVNARSQILFNRVWERLSR